MGATARECGRPPSRFRPPVSPPVDSIVPSEKLPSEVDVVVIGGGIIGVSTALFLARKGLSVLVCEKGRVGGEQSSRNWGLVPGDGPRFPRDPADPRESQDLARVGEMVGHDLGYRQCGILYLCETKAEMEGYGPWLDHSERYQIGSRLITPAQVQELIPGFARRIEGALYTATDGRAEPSRAAPGIARAVQALGGSVVTDCAVRTIERSGGRVSGVVTERGTVRCRAAVLAGGPGRASSPAISASTCRNCACALGAAHHAGRGWPRNLGLWRLRLPPAHGRRLQRRPRRCFDQRTDARSLQPVRRVSSGGVERAQEPAPLLRKAVLRGAADTEALAVRRGDAVRADPCARSGAEPARARRGDGALPRLPPGLRERSGRRELGRHDRRDTGRRSGDLRDPTRRRASSSRPGSRATASASGPARAS